MTAALADVARPVVPFIRWVGGKRQLAQQLASEIMATNPQLYVEPFLGGGAVALALPPKLPKLLADVNVPLIDCWSCIKQHPRSLLTELRAVEARYGDDKDGYLAARDAFNFMVRNPRSLWIQRSALLLYLNARCFNGLWRTNSKGLFNVPYGQLASPKQLGDELFDVSAMLFHAELRSDPFEKLLTIVFGRRTRTRTGKPTLHTPPRLRGVAIYADPPYHGVFDQYAADGFTEDDQAVLANILKLCVQEGASVWASNSDTPLIRDLYNWAEVTTVDEQHNVGATGERRGKRGCVLIRAKVTQ